MTDHLQDTQSGPQDVSQGASARAFPGWLENLSHEIRHGTMVTLGLVEMLAVQFDQKTLSREVLNGSMGNRKYTLADCFDLILSNQNRIIQALRLVEKNWESLQRTGRNIQGEILSPQQNTYSCGGFFSALMEPDPGKASPEPTEGE